MNSNQKQGQICIFCRKPIEKFSIEHVFPDTIGGGIKIKICELCNHHLGKNIDTPFVNSKLILAFRNRYQIKRDGKRKIGNPFKGKELKDSLGRDFYVEIDDGIATQHLKPIYEQPIEFQEGQFFARVTMAKKDVPENPLKLLESIEKRYGITIPNKEIYRIHVEELSEENITVPLEVSNKIKVLQFLKIAYEMACSHIYRYVDDDLATKISELLLKTEITVPELSLFFDTQQEVKARAWFENKFQFISEIPEMFHLLILSSEYDGKLKAYIRIFNLSLVIFLSNDKKEYLKEELFVINNSIERNAKVSLITPFKFKLNNYKINFDSELMNLQNKLLLFGLIADKNLGCEKHEGKESVYLLNGDNTGKTIIQIHNDAIKTAVKTISPNDFENYYEFETGKYYLKHIDSGTLFPVRSIIFCLNEGK